MPWEEGEQFVLDVPMSLHHALRGTHLPSMLDSQAVVELNRSRPWNIRTSTPCRLTSTLASKYMVGTYSHRSSCHETAIDATDALSTLEDLHNG